MAEQALARCPFCKSTDTQVLGTDPMCPDDPLYWTVACSRCKARGPAVEMYSLHELTAAEQDEMWRLGIDDYGRYEHKLVSMTRRKAILLWNACLEDNGNDH